MPSIDAHITQVVKDEASGWGKISTDDGRVKLLKTKRAELLSEAGQLKLAGVLARIEYTEREGNINQNTGKPYLDFYYDKGTALGEPASGGATGIETVREDAGTTGTTGRQTFRPTDPDDAWRMSLNSGGKLAVMTLPMMPTAQRSFEIQKRIALAWAEFFFFTPRPSQPSVNGNADSQFLPPSDSFATRSAGAYDEPVGVGAPDPDDIPF